MPACLIRPGKQTDSAANEVLDRREHRILEILISVILLFGGNGNLQNIRRRQDKRGQNDFSSLRRAGNHSVSYGLGVVRLTLILFGY